MGTQPQIVKKVDEKSWKIRPYVSDQQVKDIAYKCFGLDVSNVKEIVSYEDRNFLLEGKLSSEKYKEFNKFVLKIFNGEFTLFKHIFENNNSILLNCAENWSFQTPIPIETLKYNETIGVCKIPLQKEFICDEGSKSELISEDGWYDFAHLVRLVIYIPGQVVNVKEMNEDLLFSFGKMVAELSIGLQPNICNSCEDVITGKEAWDTMKAPYVLPGYITLIKDEVVKKLCEDVLCLFENNVLPIIHNLPKQWIHTDLNDQNILQNNKQLVGVLDFDELLYSYRVVDLATALMYFSIGADDENRMNSIAAIFRGYSSLITLNKQELKVLYTLFLVRFCASICMSNYNYNYIDLGNKYLLIHADKGKHLLKHFFDMGEKEFMSQLTKNITKPYKT
ncbi:hydroxylysine kinase [Hydra vulgaris]|uniref:hydroxylysine kinase n=1 Tax=Hydra vulgaris TaxID=6087 RepID=UPI001F5EB720|nr:hydroxylysine kinase-like [Hydra vulgaris]